MQVGQLSRRHQVENFVAWSLQMVRNNREGIQLKILTTGSSFSKSDKSWSRNVLSLLHPEDTLSDGVGIIEKFLDSRNRYK